MDGTRVEQLDQAVEQLFEELKTAYELKYGPKVKQLVKRSPEKLKTAYEKLSPEKQVLFGAVLFYVSLTSLFCPEFLPWIVKPITETIESIDKAPTNSTIMLIIMTISFVGSVDGVRKIIIKRFPFYKAYVQAFILGINIENEEGSYKDWSESFLNFLSKILEVLSSL